MLAAKPCNIEDILLDHPDVLRVSTREHSDAAGSNYTVAYAMPSPAWRDAIASSVSTGGRNERISRWRSIFDRTYALGEKNPAPSFTGWNSTYTNKPIPHQQMTEWLDGTVERLSLLAPHRVLEIGCGLGLVMQALAPRCHAYRGTDISSVAVSRLRAFTARTPALQHVELVHSEAIDFEDLTPGSVDLVVLNSVVQYFPDLAYLQTVLQRAAAIVAPGGHIFVGDVRDLGLLPTFHASVQFTRAPDEATIAMLRRKVARAIEQERELVIDPQFFMDLPQAVPAIAAAEILLKRGPTNNEITRYRYDVLLRVGAAPDVDECRPVAEWRAGGETAADFLIRFAEQHLPAVRILDVPNTRTAHDLAIARLIDSAAEGERVAEIRDKMRPFKSVGVDPGAFWEVPACGSYDLRVGWAPGSREGRFDVAIADRRRWSGVPSLQRSAASAPPSGAVELATNPLRAAFGQRLGLELEEVLRARMPAAQLPAAVLVVDELPESATGMSRA